jgi:hypothetical protein
VDKEFELAETGRVGWRFPKFRGSLREEDRFPKEIFKFTFRPILNATRN